ncbi:hypothetical protein DS745_03930 [Anaerobacillus alkaliphilus]|uniref:Uncharacterized protein n=1 Tax=Anaerobacillus alkaliphilus TaxID=1548597 RepID=A0A4Q0VYU0_9BACI|nr:hypothetical protein [Anaerobacillus alkaliphilus]RXJ04542.1 hypothetical protein DS745_03930 [Anaerobacillus alkaliphilus]
MAIELKILYSSLIMVLILGISFFYAAFSIQKKKGVIVEKFRPMLLILPTISIYQYYYQTVKLELDSTFFTQAIIIFFILLTILSYLLRNKKVIAVHDIKQEEVIAVLESQLTSMSVPYKINNASDSEKVIFSLNDEGSKIIIEGGILGEESKTFSLIFKKCHQLQQIEELHYKVESTFREKQGDKVFWTQIVINSSLGLACTVAVIYFYFRFSFVF